MGLGDAKLMAGIGLLFGWQSIPLVLFLSSILGLFFVTPSLLKKQNTMKAKCLHFSIPGSFVNRSRTTQEGSQGLGDYPQPTFEAPRDPKHH